MTPQFMKISIFYFRSSPYSGKNGWCSQRNSLILVDLTVISFFQGMDSFQFPSTFGHSPIPPNTYKIFCLEFFIIIWQDKIQSNINKCSNCIQNSRNETQWSQLQKSVFVPFYHTALPTWWVHMGVLLFSGSFLKLDCQKIPGGFICGSKLIVLMLF